MERMAPDKANAHALLASMDKGAAPAAQLGWRFPGGCLVFFASKCIFRVC
jgi:hypothetical protein